MLLCEDTRKRLANATAWKKGHTLWEIDARGKGGL